MINYIATSTFGLEAVVKREVERAGGENIKVADGRVDFSGGIELIPRLNLWLRCADRLLINVGEFYANSFDELFEKTKALPWGDWITLDGKFTVIGKSIKSQLYSVPDCQAIVKKAIVEKLKLKHNVDWFQETGPEYKVQVAILKDYVTLSIDSSGSGLHKRGYRADAVTAPLKETLAAALIDLSYWRKDRLLMDPLCGSGTIAIEGALIGKNIAPGLYRSFASERWPQLRNSMWKEEKAKAYDVIDTSRKLEIYASDIDEEAVKLAKHNAKLAGVDSCIHFQTSDIRDIEAPDSYGVLICNPPYGERIGSVGEAESLHRELGRFLNENKTWSLYVITSNEELEKHIGRRADKKRKLFNGDVKTDYFQFFGPRPPRKE